MTTLTFTEYGHRNVCENLDFRVRNTASNNVPVTYVRFQVLNWVPLESTLFWIWRRYHLQKFRLTLTRLHDSRKQEMEHCLGTSVRNPNPVCKWIQDTNLNKIINTGQFYYYLHNDVLKRNVQGQITESARIKNNKTECLKNKQPTKKK
jgi:hypothetical protein